MKAETRALLDVNDDLIYVKNLAGSLSFTTVLELPQWLIVFTCLRKCDISSVILDIGLISPAGSVVPPQLLPVRGLQPAARLAHQQRRPRRKALLQEVLQQEVRPAN